MNVREASRFLFWASEKLEANDQLTDEELNKVKEAQVISRAAASKFLRLKPEDWKYTPGEPFK